MPSNQSQPPIQRDWLAPFASFILLQCTAQDPAMGVRGLMTFVRRRLEKVRSGTVEVLASGFEGGESSSPSTGAETLDQIDGIIYRRDDIPGWATPGSPFTDSRHGLVVVGRRGDLVAIHADGDIRESLLIWLRGDPRPPFRRVASSILQGAFLLGAARGLWLRGTHRRRSTKADTKNLSGTDLRDALNPFEDSSFALASARAVVPASDDPRALSGVVGTTPRNALVWNRATLSFDDFVAVAIDVLITVEDTIEANRGVDHPYPLLAEEVGDLGGVAGAYELSIPAPGDLPASPATSTDVLDAAELLQGAILELIGESSSPNFQIVVGMYDTIGGRLGCSVTFDGAQVQLALGFPGEPSNVDIVRPILDALEQAKGLIGIYYSSGHCIQALSIYRPEVRDHPFPKWEFVDFGATKVTKEKPSDDHFRIHAETGLTNDDSLFGWVARTYTSGWLTCDDGAGEVADFVHLAEDGTVSLIHVKAATSSSESRQVSTTAYEQVASQATKNIGFFNLTSLHERLAVPDKAGRATWLDGQRQHDRSGFLAALASTTPVANLRAIIVQPHLRGERYRQLRTQGAAQEEDTRRLNRLESLLNSTRGSITSLGAELTVIASC